MSGNGTNDIMDRDFEPGEFEAVERRLRRDLRSEALRIEPHDRLDAILSVARAGAGSPAAPRRGLPRWFAPLAAAAAVGVAAGGVWIATHTASEGTAPAGTGATTPAPVATTPPILPSTGGSTPGAPTTSPPATSGGSTPRGPANVTLALPAYFVGRTGDDGGFGLYREFIRATVPGGSADAKALAALALAMDNRPSGAGTAYLKPWGSTRVRSVTVSRSLITVTLSGPGPSGQDAEVERLAVQQLAWTAQAAVGKGAIPVAFRLADGSSSLFGRFPASDHYSRPPQSEYYRDLAPVWITSPVRDQVVRTDARIRVTGEASVFEAALGWGLTRAGGVGGAEPVISGTAMASVGAPQRGTWSVDLPPLTRPGTYTLSAWWSSPKDGSILDRTSVTFTVR